MYKKIIALVVAVFIVVVAVFYFTSDKNTVKQERFGGTTNLNALTLSANLITGGINSTSTATSTGAVLNQYDLYNNNGEPVSVVSFTASTSATTLTIAASSTFTTLIPNAGDNITFWLYNASTTGTTTTIAAGTGVTLLNATTTKVLSPGGTAQLTFVRLVNSNINVLLNFFK